MIKELLISLAVVFVVIVAFVALSEFSSPLTERIAHIMEKSIGIFIGVILILLAILIVFVMAFLNEVKSIIGKIQGDEEE